MGPVLIERWLGPGPRVAIVDQAAVAVAREETRAVAAKAGLDVPTRERLVLAVSELAHNQLRHAGGGALTLREVRRAGVAGVEAVAADGGPGIADPAAALGASRVERSAGPGLGVGLAAVLRQGDEVDFDVRAHRGTCVRVRVFAAPVRRSEVAIVGCAGPQDPVSGDDADVVRDEHHLLAAVVDGLGHGPLAREASLRAVAQLPARRGDALPDLLASCDQALAATRGAVMSVVRLDLATGHLAHAGVGDVSVRIHAADGVARPLLATAGTLGTGARPRRIVVDERDLTPPEVLIMVSDGIVSRLDLRDEPAVLRQHPLLIAHHVRTHFGRGTDDLIVLVAR